MMLHVEDIELGYDGTPVVCGLDFQLEAGEIGWAAVDAADARRGNG